MVSCKKSQNKQRIKKKRKKKLKNKLCKGFIRLKEMRLLE